MMAAWHWQEGHHHKKWPIWGSQASSFVCPETSLSHSELLGLPRAIGQRDSATRAACSGKPAGLRLASSIERPLVGHPGETSFTHSDATSGDQWEPKQNFNAKPLKIKLPLEPQHTKIVQDLQAQPKQSACC